MRLKKFHSKNLSCLCLFLFFLLIWNSSFAGTGFPDVQQAEEIYNQGLELYTDGQYLKAIQKFTQVLAVAENEALLTDTYFYLSLCNYYLGDWESAKDWIRKVLEYEPGREVSSVYPKEYRDLYEQGKREYAVEIETRRREAKTEEPKPAKKPAEPPPVAVQPGVKKGGGGKTLLYVFGALVIAGGAAAAVLLLGGSDSEETVSGGSIQINSNPAGANVFLDGQDTGQVTNTTLTDVAAGSHTVGLYKDGYGDYETSVSVTDGATATLDASLTAHTITITRPKGTTHWTQGEDVEIRWNTGGGLSRTAFTALRGDTHSTASPRGYYIRLNRARMASANSRGKDLGRRGTARGAKTGKEALAGNGGISPSGKNTGTLNSPRNASLNRLSVATEGGSEPETANPQTLSEVKIELYRGGSVERAIDENAENTGSHNWTVPNALEDGTNYKIRVSCATDASVYGESEAFRIASVGKLKVMSNPSGARIWLDDEDKGLTNKTLQNIPVGEHELRLTKDRYQEWSETVEVIKNQTTNVDATLEAGGFEEKFNDGRAEHWKSYASYANWYVQNGVYKVQSDHDEYPVSIYNLGTFDNDYTFEAKLKILSGTNAEMLGIGIGTEDPATIWHLIINPGDQYYSFWKSRYSAPGKVQFPADNIIAWKNDGIVSQTEWNRCKLVVDGNNVTIYINNKMIDSLTLSDLPEETRIMLWASISGSGQIKGFDNVKLSLGETAGSIKGRTIGPAQYVRKNDYSRDEND